MSADLADIHVRVIQQACNFHPDECLMIVNTAMPDEKEMYLHETPEGLIYSHLMQTLEGKFCPFRLTGQSDQSKSGTATVAKLHQLKNPGGLVAVFDSDNLKDPSNPLTHIETPTIERAPNNATCCELIEKIDEQGNKYFGPRMTQEKVLPYLNAQNDALKIHRQTEYFGKLSTLLYTSAVSTGVSFESGTEKLVYGLLRGVSTLDEDLQSIIRPRSPVARHIWIANQALPSAKLGNGATDPNELIAGERGEYADCVRNLRSAPGGAWLPDEPYEALSAVGRAWSNYATLIACKRNWEAANYRDEFIKRAKAEGYVIRQGFCPYWSALTEGEQQAFRDYLGITKDGQFEINNFETAIVDISNADPKVLAEKTELTPVERHQKLKLSIMASFGLEAEQVTPALVAADKKDRLYSKLIRRLALEQGSKATAERDAAIVAKLLNHGLSWGKDVVRKTMSQDIELLEKLHIPELLDHLLSDPDSHVYDGHPVIDAVIESAKVERKRIQQQFRSKVGDVISVDNPDGTRESIVEVRKPMAIVKTILAQLHLGLKQNGRKRIDGEQVLMYELVDLLKKDETKEPVLDFEAFKIYQLAQWESAKNEAPTQPKRALEIPKSEGGESVDVLSDLERVSNTSSDFSESVDAYRSIEWLSTDSPITPDRFIPLPTPTPQTSPATPTGTTGTLAQSSQQANGDEGERELAPAGVIQSLAELDPRDYDASAWA